MAEQEYYYSVRDGRAGPVSFEELRALADRGHLRRTDKVWKKGAPDWLEASPWPDLFTDLPPDLPEPSEKQQPVGSSVGLILAGDSKERLRVRAKALIGLLPKPLRDPRIFVQVCTGIAFVIFFAVYGFRTLREQERQERQHARQSIGVVKLALEFAEQQGVRCGKDAAKATATGLITPGRTEVEIRTLASDIWDNPQPYRIKGIIDTFLTKEGRSNYDDPKLKEVEVQAWQSAQAKALFVQGFVDGYVQYMKEQQRRLRPAY